VVLSGIGGDEVMGGVPIPTPALADLLIRGKLNALATELNVWALARRQPVLHLLLDTIRAFLPTALVGVPRNRQPAPWLNPSFVKRNRTALQGYPARVKLFGPLPSHQDDLSTLEVIRRQLSCSSPSSEPAYEKRYPFLDLDLLEFLFSIPREQLLRPNQRRSLMRRALIGIVPDELLHRKRKAFVARSPMLAVSAQRCRLLEMSKDMVSASLGVVDPELLGTALHKVCQGQAIPMVPFMRTIGIEVWLRSLVRRQILQHRRVEPANAEPCLLLRLHDFSAESNPAPERR
jgi:asparagine synthase (glutamine-hydrolysing)